MKTCSQNIGIATEIASTYVSVWDTVSTSGLYLIVFSIVRRCRRQCGVPENYVVAVEITMIIFRRKVITTSGIRPLSWSLWVKKASGEVGMYTSKNLAPKNIGIDTEIASISVPLLS